MNASRVPSPSPADAQNLQTLESLRHSEEHQPLLLALSDALNALTNPADILDTASRVLGERVGADRVGYAEAQADGKTITIKRDYRRGVPSLVGTYQYDDYGPVLLKEFRAGKTVVRSDIANDAMLTEEEKQAHAVLQLGATLNKPLLSDGRLVAVLFVHHSQAYQWTARDLALVEETAQRTWDAVCRARAEEDLRAAYERAEEANRIKDQFLATLSRIAHSPQRHLGMGEHLTPARVGSPNPAAGLGNHRTQCPRPNSTHRGFAGCLARSHGQDAFGATALGIGSTRE